MSSVQGRPDAVRGWQPNVLPQRRSVWMMMTRTVLCLPVLIVPSVGRWELHFMSPVAVAQLTRVALMMESMLPPPHNLDRVPLRCGAQSAGCPEAQAAGRAKCCDTRVRLTPPLSLSTRRRWAHGVRVFARLKQVGDGVGPTNWSPGLHGPSRAC